MPVIARDDAELSAHAIFRVFGTKALELTLFGLIMLVIGRRILPALLVFIARAKSRELFSLGAFALALGIAYAAQTAFATTFALGAFIAGLALNEAELSHRAAEDLTPLRDAFAVLFFVSVGMLFKPQMLMTETWTVLAVLAVIVAGNWGAAYLIMTAVKLPLPQKLAVASGLAQIGEFSFLISRFGLSLDLVSERTHALITAGALLAIAINPVIHGIAQLIARWSHAPQAGGEVAESA
jgi:CPA2 family monovalent cation:H+ antiporter-2